MEEWKNPVIERQIFWFEHAWNETLQNSSEGKYKVFFLISALSADQNKSIPKEDWFNFVDGIFYLILLVEGKGYKFSLSKIEALTKRGFEEIISYLRRPEFQKAVIDRHHYGSGTKDLGDGFQTTLDNESLFSFNRLANVFLIGEESITELIEKFIQKKKMIFGLERPKESRENPNPEKNNEKPKLNTVSKGIVLHYLMEYGSYPFSTDNDVLTGYLEKLGLPTSIWEGKKTGGKQAYKNGALALPIYREDRPKRPEKPGMVTKQEFLNAVNFLKTQDSDAYQAANYDFNIYCREELEHKESNGTMFFRK